jgi:hypothetical protein
MRRSSLVETILPLIFIYESVRPLTFVNSAMLTDGKPDVNGGTTLP